MLGPRLHMLATVAGLAIASVLLGTCNREATQTSEPAIEVAEPTPLRGWDYAVTLAPSLASADVQVCFDGPAPSLLVPGIEEARDHGRDCHVVGDPQPLPLGERGYTLDGVPDDACVEYTVDFDGLQAEEGVGRSVGRTGASLLARPSTWLWRPAVLPDDPEVTLRLSVPEGMQVSVPWPTRGDAPRNTNEAVYVLDSTVFRWLSYAVFGEFEADHFERAGAEVELVTLDAPIAAPPEGLRQVAHDAIDTVAMLFEGRFPRDRLQLLVMPVEGNHGGSIYFGMAGRGGGSCVLLFVDDEAQTDDLIGGWTTVHELLHHGMPFIDDPWMGEGWVSYYTELMRTRVGHRSEREGWQALVDAFARGRRRALDISLQQTSDQMHLTHAYQRVYWGGASVALLADVQMRLESDGERTLDQAIRELRRCCGDADHVWTAQALLERLDAWYGRPLFTETAQQVLRERTLPDVEAAMARLGVHVEDGEVRLDDSDPRLVRIRRDIMAPRG